MESPVILCFLVAHATQALYAVHAMRTVDTVNTVPHISVHELVLESIPVLLLKKLLLTGHQLLLLLMMLHTRRIRRRRPLRSRLRLRRIRGTEHLHLGLLHLEHGPQLKVFSLQAIDLAAQPRDLSVQLVVPFLEAFGIHAVLVGSVRFQEAGAADWRFAVALHLYVSFITDVLVEPYN